MQNKPGTSNQIRVKTKQQTKQNETKKNSERKNKRCIQIKLKENLERKDLAKRFIQRVVSVSQSSISVFVSSIDNVYK